MPLPQFLIAGERRCGTTTLSNLLDQHQDIVIHPKRDGGFFIDEDVRKGTPSSNWSKTHSLADYEAFFSKLPVSGSQTIAEKSADYLSYHPAHQRIATLLPNAKFVFILRNPVDRAWSHYWNEVAKRRENHSFEDALKLEPERLAKGGFEAYHLSYMSRGQYHKNLNAFYEHIPKQRCHVVILEDLIKQKDNTLNDITNFLGIGSFGIPAQDLRSNPNWAMVTKPWASRQPLKSLALGYGNLAKLSASVVNTKREKRRELAAWLSRPFFMPASSLKMKPELREHLMELYEPHNFALEQLLGRSIPQWAKA
jgi:hypothetical protein